MKCDAFYQHGIPALDQRRQTGQQCLHRRNRSTSPQPPFAMAASAIWLLIFPVQIRRSILFFAAWSPTSACICSSFSQVLPCHQGSPLYGLLHLAARPECFHGNRICIVAVIDDLDISMVNDMESSANRLQCLDAGLDLFHRKSKLSSNSRRCQCIEYHVPSWIGTVT